MSPILPFEEKEKKIPRSVYLPESLWKRLDAIAEQSKHDDPSGKGHDRTGVIYHFLLWAADEYDKERAAKRKK